MSDSTMTPVTPKIQRYHCFLASPSNAVTLAGGGRGGQQAADSCFAGSGCPNGEDEQAARIFATIQSLRAMSCQINEIDGLLLQAEYDNAEF